MTISVQSKAELHVTPIIQHFWVNQSSGVFDPGEQSLPKSLEQLMLDGHEALSGTRYVPQTSSLSGGAHSSSLTGGVGHGAGITSSQLKSKIRAKLQNLGNEELFTVFTNPEAFMRELQCWLRETEAGKKHAEASKSLLQAAQASKDLVAVGHLALRCALRVALCCMGRSPTS
jgi:hypothetical protein